MSEDAPPVVAVAVAGARLGFLDPGTTVVTVGAGESLAVIANRLWDERRCHLVLVGEPVEFPTAAFEPALAIVAGDRRVATVSFLHDGAGLLGFPRPRSGEDPPAGALDPDTTTGTLRSRSPALAPSPIPFASGPAVLVAAAGRSAVGPLAEFGGTDAFARMQLDYSRRGRARGFAALVDPSTYCRRVGAAGASPALSEPETTLVAEYEAPESPLAVVHATARAKVCGLHVLIDAARLSPQEMGTQVATVALIRALARRPDVARVCVALAGELPPYAASLADDPKVDARVTPGRDFTDFGGVDIAHRPFQPDSPADMDACRAVADRTAITVLDLIAYHAVSYQLAPEDWRTYRAWLRQSVMSVDAVIAPTADVRGQILVERLPVDADRLFVAELGTDHLTGEEPQSAPATGDTDLSGGFVVVLGADYTHKNRDLAVLAHQDLRRRGFDLPLVLAGTPVHGSSRLLEEAARQPDQRIVGLADVSSAERNWLLAHASVVLYPTSGEGFGLVPFEAARFGTPAAFVPFGPLAELAPALPVYAEDWSPVSLAEAAAALLADGHLARAQVEAVLAAGRRFTWDAGAAALAAVYREILARPPAAVPAPAPGAPPAPAPPAPGPATRPGALMEKLRERARQGLR